MWAASDDAFQLAVMTTGNELRYIVLKTFPLMTSLSEGSKQRYCARVWQSTAMKRLEDVVALWGKPSRWGYRLWQHVWYRASIIATLRFPLEGWGRLSRMAMAAPLTCWGLTLSGTNDNGFGRNTIDRHDTAVVVLFRVHRGRRRGGKLGGR